MLRWFAITMHELPARMFSRPSAESFTFDPRRMNHTQNLSSPRTNRPSRATSAAGT